MRSDGHMPEIFRGGECERGWNQSNGISISFREGECEQGRNSSDMPLMEGRFRKEQTMFHHVPVAREKHTKLER